MYTLYQSCPPYSRHGGDKMNQAPKDEKQHMPKSIKQLAFLKDECKKNNYC